VPGATITVWGPEPQKRVVTDDRGCYEISDLSPRAYTVTAILIGFCHSKRNDVVVTSSEATRVNLTLRVGAIEGAPPPDNLREMWDYADVAVHGRITAGPGPRSPRYTATVLDVFRWYPTERPDSSEITFSQMRPGAPYLVGDEVVVFLRDAGASMMQPFDGQAGFVIRDGGVHPINKALAALDGITVEDFLAKLRALANEDR
jgi:hypothetical protein